MPSCRIGRWPMHRSRCGRRPHPHIASSLLVRIVSGFPLLMLACSVLAVAAGATTALLRPDSRLEAASRRRRRRGGHRACRDRLPRNGPAATRRRARRRRAVGAGRVGCGGALPAPEPASDGVALPTAGGSDRRARRARLTAPRGARAGAVRVRRAHLPPDDRRHVAAAGQPRPDAVEPLLRALPRRRRADVHVAGALPRQIEFNRAPSSNINSPTNTSGGCIATSTLGDIPPCSRPALERQPAQQEW